MFSARLVIAMTLCPLAAATAAEIPWPDSCQVTCTFSHTYNGNYRPGQPYDYVTIQPDGRGETFAETGISIAVVIKGSAGQPFGNTPRQEIILYNPNLCICPGGNIADVDTDIHGRTTFSGTISGGGCAQSLTVYMDGVPLGTLPVNINSPDTRASSPCFVDAGDVAALAAR